MNPRFSILHLIVLTAYVAVTIGGLLDPVKVGGVSILMIWVAAVITFASRAAGAPSPRRAFARAFMAVCLICASVAMLARHPDQAIVNLLEERGLLAPSAEDYDRALGYARLTMAHGSLALGLAGGCFAQHLHRGIESHDSDGAAATRS